MKYRFLFIIPLMVLQSCLSLEPPLFTEDAMEVATLKSQAVGELNVRYKFSFNDKPNLFSESDDARFKISAGSDLIPDVELLNAGIFMKSGPFLLNSKRVLHLKGQLKQKNGLAELGMDCSYMVNSGSGLILENAIFPSGISFFDMKTADLGSRTLPSVFLKGIWKNNNIRVIYTRHHLPVEKNWLNDLNRISGTFYSGWEDLQLPIQKFQILDNNDRVLAEVQNTKNSATLQSYFQTESNYTYYYRIFDSVEINDVDSMETLLGSVVLIQRFLLEVSNYKNIWGPDAGGSFKQSGVAESNSSKKQDFPPEPSSWPKFWE